MAANENKHCEQLAERRFALFGDAPPKVKPDDIFDVEAPDVGAPRWDMSPLKAYQVALMAERKAHAFYDQALRWVTPAGRQGAVRGAAGGGVRARPDAERHHRRSCRRRRNQTSKTWTRDPYKPAKYRAPF